MNKKSTFQRIWENIEYAVKNLPSEALIIRMNLDKTNLRYKDVLTDMITSAFEKKVLIGYGRIWLCHERRRYKVRDKGGEQIEEIPDSEFTEKEKEWREKLPRLNIPLQKIIPFLDFFPCIAQRNDFFCLDHTGGVYKCFVDVGDPLHQIGNVSKPLSLYNKNFLKYYLFEPWKYEPCGSCPGIPMCFGGCVNRRIFREPEVTYCCGKITQIKETLNSIVKKMCKEKDISVKLNKVGKLNFYELRVY